MVKGLGAAGDAVSGDRSRRRDRRNLFRPAPAHIKPCALLRGVLPDNLVNVQGESAPCVALSRRGQASGGPEFGACRVLQHSAVRSDQADGERAECFFLFVHGGQMVEPAPLCARGVSYDRGSSCPRPGVALAVVGINAA